VPVSAHLGEPVGLGDWTVRELVAHLGLGIGLSRFVTTAAPEAEGLPWIRLATGGVSSDDPYLPLF
jgi:hypothetical protein